MAGDARLGAVLRELRRSRGLTLAAVARQAGRVESLVSYANTGQPEQAVPLALTVLDDNDRIGSSWSARAELRRSVPSPRRWHARDDDRTLLHRLTPATG